MAQECTFMDYRNKHRLKATETNLSDTEQSGRRLFRIGVLTIGVLCIIQATLNISLHLAFYSKEDTNQLLVNISMIADVCKTDQLSSCCNNLLRRLLRNNKGINIINITTYNDNYEESGSGPLVDLFS